MDFNSFQYILIFLPVVFLICQIVRLLPLPKAPQIWILLSSMFFYTWHHPAYLPYLLGSILVNWQLARWISNAEESGRKRCLQLGLVLNIAFLCTFKYVNFLLGNIPYFVRHGLLLPNLGFPLGISFFTLAQIMYLVDCYEELIPPSSLFDHATFVSFFPYVISGPLSRTKRILHQFPSLNGPTGPPADVIARALYLFSLGLVKKVVLSDSYSKVADYAFSNISSLSALEAWTGAVAFSLQIYFDFSGYSDMAIASALLFGIEIPRNFDSPLRATSIVEYWQRWHISLTSFITTYLYTPILRSFSRVTLFTSAIATLLAMTIAGLWHGPNWTFVIFGAIHGLALAINQYWRKKKMPTMPDPISWLLTFVVFEIAFVFFHAPDTHTALLYTRTLFSWQQPLITQNFHRLIGLNVVGLTSIVFLVAQATGVVVVIFAKSSDQLARNFKPTTLTYATAVACTLIAFLYLNSNVVKPFVYFAF